MTATLNPYHQPNPCINTINMACYLLYEHPKDKGFGVFQIKFLYKL